MLERHPVVCRHLGGVEPRGVLQAPGWHRATRGGVAAPGGHRCTRVVVVEGTLVLLEGLGGVGRHLGCCWAPGWRWDLGALGHLGCVGRHRVVVEASGVALEGTRGGLGHPGGIGHPGWWLGALWVLLEAPGVLRTRGCWGIQVVGGHPGGLRAPGVLVEGTWGLVEGTRVWWGTWCCWRALGVVLEGTLGAVEGTRGARLNDSPFSGKTCAS